MSRAKLFVENFLAYGFINVLNKIIPLLLLPVITRLLPNTEAFGFFDMFNLIIGFGTPLAVMGLYDAMFREYFEKDDQQYKYDVTTTTQRIILFNSIIISIVLIVFSSFFSNLFFGVSEHSNIIMFASVALLFSANRSPIQAPTRMENKRKIFVISGLLESGGYYLLSILLINLGFSYYGLIYAKIMTIPVLVLFFWFQNKKFFLKGKFNKKIAKELLKIGLPLTPVFLIYWVYRSMDRIMITNILGTSELGVYALGAKYAMVSQLIYTAFAGGWQYFAFSTMKDNDYKKMLGNIWEVLFIISTYFFILMFLFKDIIFKLLFEGDFVRGVEVFPFLVLAPLLLMLYQILGTQFQVTKKTYLSPLVLSIGVVVNILLNLYLIPIIGIKGAALATVMGYVISLLVTVIVVMNKKLITFRKRIYINILTFSILFVFYYFYFNDYKITIIVSILYIIISAISYFKIIKNYIKKLRR
ncbi:oligosaccharide flippase family protein [Geotoga petraea]|uniref:Membrane protein involved in the export of O-antigen and teichoic acid n=1 Tax=Geotoga petraea TaxID=28234 RepID=A0A1G6PHX5_9BACT|nr:oligosaccharide flippase family protein [Geotoga petraea]SDC79753.1 Membrane protein involved in the export of O-antigen and teichoic acid [Geotoga petraea]